MNEGTKTSLQYIYRDLVTFWIEWVPERWFQSA